MNLLDEMGSLRDGDAPRERFTGVPHGAFARYWPQVAVAVLVVIVLAGGAFYASRVSESAPRVVYKFSLEGVEAQAQDSLQVNINTADVEELDELPAIGPATAEAIVEHRRTNGTFRSVEELEEIEGIGPTTLEEIEPFATV
jgi:competence protein ComEA